ncbi:response regulator transcription factor [Tessaracoccus caeni]|uniref:response regulator transcription factor n=1 Tax=Tessaracoccus caeni TaxID=3031239 RepID=UPI0023DBFBB2|nr:response regulator transcription factor [Tessaracoccus caeni]MDF1487403.1 response regulator transcription factor [Tessaracoccus caeni]
MTMERPLRVVIADDQAMIRYSLRMIVDDAEDMTVVGDAEDGRAAVHVVRRTKPDVVLMDVRMPHLDGIGAIAAIEADPSLEDTVCLVLTTFDDEDYLAGALAAGAGGFLLKDVEPELLLTAIRRVANGDSVLDPAVTARVVSGYVSQRGTKDNRIGLLSARELEVLEGVTEGLSNLEIGQRLFCSEATVKSHVRSMLSKLNLSNRVQLVIFAYESRFVTP